MAGTPAMLDALFNHLVFPPNLPHQQDKLGAVESALLSCVHSVAKNLRNQLQGHFQAAYDALQSSLQICCSIHVDRSFDRRALAHELLNIQPKRVLILHITEQNAGLLIWRRWR
jgi:hypothetical protein